MARILEEMGISLEEVLLLPPQTLETVLAAMQAINARWDSESITDERDTDRWEQRLRHATGHGVGY